MVLLSKHARALAKGSSKFESLLEAGLRVWHFASCYTYLGVFLATSVDHASINRPSMLRNPVILTIQIKDSFMNTSIRAYQSRPCDGPSVRADRALVTGVGQ